MSKGFAANPRMTLLAAGVLGCFVAVAVRLVSLHVVDRDELLKFVEKARNQITVEQARRGAILDARGNVLAISRSEVTLAVDPWAAVEYLEADRNPARRERKRAEEQAKRAQLAAILGLPAAEVDRFFTPLRRNVPLEKDLHDDAQDGLIRDRWVKIREGLDESTYDRIAALNLRGIVRDRHYQRVYPGGQLASHLLGFVNRENSPVTGVEYHFDMYLRGQDGWIETERDGARRELAQFRSRDVPAQDGSDVVLTIDSVVQHIIEEELQGIAAKFRPNFATIIVSEPHTGRILGLANYPSFDLNHYGQAPLSAQRNYAVTDVIEPGSTFKIVAAGAALNEGLVTPFTMFDCGNPVIDYKGRSLKLPRDDEPFGVLNVAGIVSHSSNRGAAQLAMMLGEQRFYDYVCKYGFGAPTGFQLGGEVRGLLEPPLRWDGLTISRMPMGHAIAATPLQIHMAMAAVANGGTLLRPQVIREVRDPAGRVVRTFEPEQRGRVLHPQAAATLARLLAGVVREGTAKGFDLPGFEIAGKTGTTQKIVDGKYSSSRHIGSFVGFFPASRPELVLTVIVDDAQVAGGTAWGRVVAAPAFKHIAEQLIQYLDIKPVIQPAPGRLLAQTGGGE